MPNTYHQMYLHMVFAVKYRNAVLHKSWRNQVFAVMGNLINESNCKTIIVNGVEDHVHCFVGQRPSVSVSDLMQKVKAKSSKYINEHHLTTDRFEWQEGFGVFSYHKTQIDNVYKYIEQQEEHHQTKSFREEYIQLLKEFEVDYDEQYIFKELI
jgi:putative transposase